MASCLLLVEDDPLYGRAMRRLLADQGFLVPWATSYAEAQDLVGGISVDYAVVDDRLGDGFGVDLLPRLDALRPKPTVALVSAFWTATRSIALQGAGRIVVPKPTTFAEMLELISLLQKQPRNTPRDESLPFGRFTLERRGLHTPDGFVALSARSTEMLQFLVLNHSPVGLTAVEIAVRALGRRDRAGPVRVRRQIADLRGALGSYAWVIESAAKQGYRIAAQAFETP